MSRGPEMSRPLVSKSSAPFFCRSSAPRRLAVTLAACGVASAVVLGGASVVPQPAVMAQQGRQPEEADVRLRRAVEDYWHFGKVARYDVAAQRGRAILDAGADPAVVLRAFEEVVRQRAGRLTGGRGDTADLYPQIARWQNVDNEAMSQVSRELDQFLSQGRLTRREDAQFITSNIERLSVNNVAYGRALENLRNSGELAVPFMVRYLQDRSQIEHHAGIRRALRDMGNLALNPLLAATQMRDYQTLPTILLALGDLGLDPAVPYLARVAQASDVPQPVRDAARRGLSTLGADANTPAAQSFYELAERLYNGRSALRADERLQAASVWYFNENEGLVRRDVPPIIFNEVMAMRAAEYALRLGQDTDRPLSLWLAANYKRETDLPQGAADPTRGDNQPDAHYYGVTAGGQYLREALRRALDDGDSAVALAVLRSMQDVVGQGGVLAGTADNRQPLVEALNYPDRRVRFEAALALAAANPGETFNGANQVVPLLAEALSQTGRPQVLLVSGSQDDVNALAELLREADFEVVGAAGSGQTREAASNLRSVDVVVIDTRRLSGNDVERVLQSATGEPRLRGAARLLLVETTVSPYEERRGTDRLLSTAAIGENVSLADAIRQARVQAGALPLDADLAAEYAQRAGTALARVAIDRGSVYDVTAGRNGLLAALDDERQEIVRIAGGVLGLIDAEGVQPALLERAGGEQIDPELRIDLYRALAENARRFGNRLDDQGVERLTETVRTAPDLDLRGAAAEARGALDLPPDQAKTLVLEQSRV